MTDELETHDDVDVLFEWEELKGRGRSRSLKRLCHGQLAHLGEDMLFVVEKEQVNIGGEWQVPEHETDQWVVVSDRVQSRLSGVEELNDD